MPIESYLGQSLQMTANTEDDGEVTVFDGFIVNVALKYEIYGSYTARIEAVTRSYKMDLTERKAYYLKKRSPTSATSLRETRDCRL